MPVTPRETRKKVDETLIPQNLEAEEAVLGAILVNPETLAKVSDTLLPKSFYKPAHRYIYEAMLQLFNNNDNIDIVSVSDVLNYSGKLESVGGRAYINDLVENTITTSNIAYYAKIIQEKAVKRALINAGSEIVSKGYDLEPSDRSLEQAEKLIFDIGSSKATADLKHVKDLVLDTWDNIEYRFNHKDELSGLRTDFTELDNMMSGLHRSDLIILAARPAMGKTAFALNLATYAATHSNKSVAIFNLEMSAEQLANRILQSLGQIDGSKMRTGRLEHNDWKRLNEAISQLSDTNLFLDDTPGITIGEIRSKCRRLANSDKGLGLVVIDYLQLITGPSKSAGNRQQEVSDISRNLKTMALELGIPVIALAQLSRAVEQREDKRPIMSDLRESGSIEQDADIVSFLYRDDYYNKEARRDDNASISEFIIGKNRSGPTTTVELLFKKDTSTFVNFQRESGE